MFFYNFKACLCSKNLGSKLSCLLTRASLLHSHATSFGYKQVPEEEKRKLVGNVFSSVASSYDLMNDLMSAGLHRLWKDRLVSKLHPIPGMKYLVSLVDRIFDSINSVSRRTTQGTFEGDLDDETQINVCDINPNMLSVGKKHAAERGLGDNRSLVWVEGDAEALKFGDNTMDGYTIAFGIRNVKHIEKALSEAYRILLIFFIL
ncbi:hypothetical protein MKW98_023143 [Papaver atlanticum]|uniref:2-methoxy-6-polyprenyl-1,4-benzoquinol methylase, mitochondrial n=1 Tax=Papaver atlanticum TaxID=357466 RepID=A0AAD4TAB7_9MAGN|nr:hypothetical protein MKW98_023143 [Papaver atlanticum]